MRTITSILVILFYLIMIALLWECKSKPPQSITVKSDTTYTNEAKVIESPALDKLDIPIGETIEVKDGDINFTIERLTPKKYIVSQNKAVIRQEVKHVSFVLTKSKIKIDNSVKEKGKRKNIVKVKEENNTDSKNKSGFKIPWWWWLMAGIFVIAAIIVRVILKKVV